MNLPFLTDRKTSADKPLEQPEEENVVVSDKTREYFEPFRPVICYDCGGSVVYDEKSEPQFDCNNCIACDGYKTEEQEFTRLVRIGFTKLRAGEERIDAKKAYLIPACRLLIANIRRREAIEYEGPVTVSAQADIQREQHRYNIMLHLITHSDEIMTLLTEPREVQLQKLAEIRDAQEKAVAEKGRIIESAGE